MNLLVKFIIGGRMSAKQTKGRSTKTGRVKKGAKTAYIGNGNASGNHTKKKSNKNYKGNNNARKKK